MSGEDTESWHWADADGVISIVDEWELLSSLSTGSLPHYILVWREGWKDWHPACRVGELANTIPKDKVETAEEIVTDPAITDPPHPPTDRYHAYQTRDAVAKLLGKAPKASVRPAPPPTGKMAPPPPPPAPLPRPAQPTLVEGAQASSTATLRPPGAVPPPPRAIPGMAAIVTSDPSPVPAVVAPVAPVIQILAPSGPESTDAPTNPKASAGPLSGHVSPLPSWSDDLDAELRAGRARGPTAAATPLAPVVAAAPKKSSLLWVVLLLVIGIGGLGVVGLGLVFLRAKSASTPGTTPTTSSPSGGISPRGPTLACKLVKPAARLAPQVLPQVQPVTAIVAGDKFAIGFAAAEREAEGILVTHSNLLVDRPYRQKTEHDISSVVPLVQGGDITFTVDEDEKEFRSPRTLDTRPKVTVGWTSQGLARRAAGGDPATIWQTPSEKVTDPRVAALPSGGFAVTTRRGGTGGSVLVGLTDEKGEKRTELTEVASKPQVGTPTVAAGERGVLLAFAGRPTDDSYWTLQLASASPGEVPKVAQTFATPPGGLGADAASPAIEGAAGGRWLLQWTEGAAGRRQVRIQTLGFDLVPVGDPINLSPEEANAGQGVVMVRGDKALSLFLVKKGKTHELWGATLSCP